MDQKHYFLVGIGGIGMQALARLLNSQGARVSGSDMKDFEARTDLEREGIEVFIGHDERHVVEGMAGVIYSIAVPQNNPEIEKAKELGIPLRRRLELVGELISSQNHP